MTQYLLAKKFKRTGCVAIETSNISDLTIFRNALDLAYYDTGLQFVVISRPVAYPEYSPYYIVEDEITFRREVLKLRDLPDNIEGIGMDDLGDITLET